MSQTHIHLLITHLPIFGSVLGAIVLIQALISRSDAVKNAAYTLFILSGIGAGIAYFTGEAAEESVEKIPGVLETAIEQHEEAALLALVAMIVLGVFAIIGLWLNFKKTSYTKQTALIILFVSLVGFGLVARTGYLGGQIRHTELNNGTIPQPGQGGGEQDND